MMRFILAGIAVLMVATVGFMAFEAYRARFGGEPFGAPFTLTDSKGAP